jgi:dolichol-phosphate mannosyltransferase
MRNQYMQPLSVIVPTLNEVESMPLLFYRIHKALSSARIPYEIVVVDDRSNDGTAEFVRDADSKYNARLITKKGKRGKSFSLLEGFEAAQYELICMIDGDLQYPPEAIKLMYHKLQYMEADIVLTNRAVNSTSAFRKLSTYIFNLFFTRLLFGIKYDTQSGLKLFRRDVLRHISLSPSPWTFDLEFIVRALENDCVITSQDIIFSERKAGEPKINMLEATLEIASGSIRLWRNSSTKRVKLRYKYLQALHSKVLLCLVGLATAVSLFLAAPSSGQANALSLPVVSPVLATATKDVDNTLKKVTTLPTSSSTTIPSTPTIAGSSSSTTTSASSSNPTASSTTISSSTTTSDISESLTTGTSIPTTKLKEGYAQSTTNSGASNLAPVASSSTKPNSNAAQSAKIADYYQNSKLSTSLTSRLLKIAIYILALAGILIFGSLLIMGTRKIINRITRQPLRN